MIKSGIKVRKVENRKGKSKIINVQIVTEKGNLQKIVVAYALPRKK